MPRTNTRSTFNVRRLNHSPLSIIHRQWSVLARVSVAALLLAGSYGCTLAKVDVNVVSERTSLENQVLGTYNALSEDVLLVASVRGVSPTGKVETPPKHSPEQQEAAQALENIAFHADDVEALKRLGWVGENLEGTLTSFSREVPEKAPADLKTFAGRFGEGEFRQVVNEVNRSREILMLRVVQTNENFTAKDLPAIRRVFARVNRQNSAPGTKVQEDDGKWVTR
ncbi:DUF1318 domain-containing protein [Geomonas sp. Red421]|uniref:DUF1318 domain-containing protein n=1 Tax=Geomonas anaerohicana TaxID=2798583 RepID=A0ABS0YA12_9BACT|nr:DUF1318 domain-containing protein [Geomonas anaerohicana]